MSSNFEEAIIQSIAAQFFAPVPFPVTDANGNFGVQFSPSPAFNVASTIFQTHKDKILDAVIAKMDIETIAEEVAKKVISEITARPTGSGWWVDHAAKEFQATLRERVISKLADMKAEEIRGVLDHFGGPDAG